MAKVPAAATRLTAAQEGARAPFPSLSLLVGRRNRKRNRKSEEILRIVRLIAKTQMLKRGAKSGESGHQILRRALRASREFRNILAKTVLINLTEAKITELIGVVLRTKEILRRLR
jgi:hypothetical protein